MIAIIDYGVGNLFSLVSSLKKIGAEAVVTNEEAVIKAADKLMALGVHRMFISMGGNGVLAAMEGAKLRLPNIPGNVVNTTGCGDAFMAALVWAYLQGTDLETTARAGLAAGSIAMESNETINPNMSAEALINRMEQ